MGGRKSYSAKSLLGSSKPVKEAFQTLKTALDSAKIKDIGKSAFKAFSEAKNTINYSAYSNKLAPAIIANYSAWKAEKDDNKLRREIGKAWSDVKKKNKISVPKEVDRVVVENALKALRGDRNE